MNEIVRLQAGPRMSQAVIHADTVYLAGQVALGAPGAGVEAQAVDILTRIDGLLADAGSDKSRLLSASIWLSDMSEFERFNRVWDAWVATGAAPARACVKADLAAPQYTVEIAVVAAVARYG